jgi:hypothetical protein
MLSFWAHPAFSALCLGTCFARRSAPMLVVAAAQCVFSSTCQHTRLSHHCLIAFVVSCYQVSADALPFARRNRQRSQEPRGLLVVRLACGVDMRRIRARIAGHRNTSQVPLHKTLRARLSDVRSQVCRDTPSSGAWPVLHTLFHRHCGQPLCE